MITACNPLLTYNMIKLILQHSLFVQTDLPKIRLLLNDYSHLNVIFVEIFLTISI